MTDKEKDMEEQVFDVEVPLYIAKLRRNEVDGEVYDRGDTTLLKGLTVEQIGHVVGHGYYGVTNPNTLSQELVLAIEMETG